MALNFNPELIKERDLQNNLRSLDRHLGDSYYTRDLTPPEFAVEAAGAIILDPGTLRYPVIQLPKATVRARASMRKPSEWRTGALSITIEYTSDVGAVANFRLSVVADAYAAGTALPGTSLLVTEYDIPGPAVANVPLVTGPLYTTTNFGSDRLRFGFGVARNGVHANDLNANDLLILGVVIEHMPARMEVS